MSAQSSSFWSRFFFGDDSSSDPNGFEAYATYLNQEAVVTMAITPGDTGQVFCRGVFWQARSRRSDRLPLDSTVRVIGRTGTTLWVELIHYPAIRSSS